MVSGMQVSQRTEINVEILRRDGSEAKPYRQHFRIPYRSGMNVISVLMEIQVNPVTADGKTVAPVVWDCSCLEEVCGACSMFICGRPRQACSALIDQLPDPIILEPLHKFPVVRDLVVDRQVMFDNLKRVKAWIHIDGTYPIGSGPRMNEKIREKMYAISKCMTCGCCLSVCPQVNDRSAFVGAAPIAQVRLFNAHPTGSYMKSERLDALLEDGGVAACGNAQNCVRACPKQVPLAESIADVGMQTTLRAAKRFLFG